MIIGINCGHTKSGVGSGANGFLNESAETRAVGYPLIEMLRADGHTVIDCTDDKASSVSANLKRICVLANAQPLDMFLSIHFNAGGGSGTEVYTYGSGDAASAGKIKSALYALGFKDRGLKDGSNLYVIKNTKAPAALVEVCFVDSQTDAELYQKLGANKIAKAIAEAITGKKADTNKDKEELPMIYNYIDDNMPDWARPTIQKLVDKGILKGDENCLNLTEDAIRILVINDRAGLYDKLG